MRSQRSRFFAPSPLMRATLRSISTGTTRAAPSSAAFCTTKSSLSSLGKPGYKVTRTSGSFPGNSVSRLTRTRPFSVPSICAPKRRPCPSSNSAVSPSRTRSTLLACLDSFSSSRIVSRSAASAAKNRCIAISSRRWPSTRPFPECPWAAGTLPLSALQSRNPSVPARCPSR